MKKRTKIIASLGPSTSTGTKLEKMMLAGTDVFRINLSHTSIEDAKTLIDLCTNLICAFSKLSNTFGSPYCTPEFDFRF